jgi:hypothetical protein
MTKTISSSHPWAGRQRRATRLAVQARAVSPGDPDYARWWQIVNDANADHHRTYQSRTTRPIPVVVLTPVVRSPEAGRGSTPGA